MMDGVANWLLAYAVAHVLASLVIVPVACLALRMRAITPDRRAALLLLAFVLVVVGPAMPLPTNVAGEAVATPSIASIVVEPSAADVGTALPVATQGEEHGGIAVAPGLAALLLMVWLAGMAWALARLLVAHARLRRIAAASRRSPALENAYRQVVPVGVEILISPALGPAAIGILQPRIILPHSMAMALPADALRAVLLHEATHHRRKDVHVLLVQRLVEAVFWWNPVVRLLGAASEAAREVACDISAARAYGASTDYAEALLDSITHFVPSKSHANARALCAAASLSTLDRRIDAIIEAPRSPGWMNKAMLPGVGGALMLLCIGTSLAAPDIAVKQAVDPVTPVAMHESHAVPSDGDALLVLHDRYSQSVYASHDRYTQVLRRLTESYTRELSALAEDPRLLGKEARLVQLNARYGHLFSDTESRFREAAAQAEKNFLTTRNALSIRSDSARSE